MIPASRAASRVALTASGAALLALLIALSGCGGDTPASAGAEVEVTAKQTRTKLATERTGVSDRCRKQVGGFVGAMDTLRERLANGMSYEEYVAEIDLVRDSYDGVPVGKLTLGCLSSAGTPAEGAFGEYIEAANSWGACIDESGCEAATVEPVLQKQWKAASRLLDQAQAGLRA